MPRATSPPDPTQRWYVYALVDPRDGETFYVGKGQKDRAQEHERSVRGGRPQNVAKTARIQQILDAGLSVDVRILRRFADEAESYRFERDTIAAHCGLTNIAKGGRGGSGRPHGIPNARTLELRALAQPYAVVALKALIDVATNGKNPKARQKAAHELALRRPLLVMHGLEWAA